MSSVAKLQSELTAKRGTSSSVDRKNKASSVRRGGNMVQSKHQLDAVSGKAANSRKRRPKRKQNPNSNPNIGKGNTKPISRKRSHGSGNHVGDANDGTQTNESSSNKRRKRFHCSNVDEKKKERKNGKAKKEEKAEVELKMIKKEEVEKLPVISWNGPIQVLTTEPEMKDAVKEILDSGEKLLGFDTESRPCFAKGHWNPTAMIQIATSSTCYLFRISFINFAFRALLPILESSSIIKVGVSIKQDVNDLQRKRKFNAAGFVDITNITKDILGYGNGGLGNLAAIFLKGKLEKTKSVQMCNWEKVELPPKAIQYAANDAWAGRAVYAEAKKQADLIFD